MQDRAPEPNGGEPRPPLRPGEVDTLSVPILRVQGGAARAEEDLLVVEEPLEIRLGYGPEGDRRHLPLSVTMRTPGSDLDLAAGFLFTEGIIRGDQDLWSLEPCGPLQRPGLHRNGVRAELQPDLEPDLERLERHFYTTSSCGVCGKTSLESLEVTAGRGPLTSQMRVPSEVVHRLPGVLRRRQALFGRTGGLHAAALFEPDGEIVAIREDVGRHNALDKLVGVLLRARQLPMEDRILLLSGRASFELLQKAFMAGAAVVCAVGAPSSLAVELAGRFGITLVGWVREDRFSIYTHPERVRVG